MKALIVAREEFDLSELSEGFARFGFEVATAPSATFALSFLERYHPDVTICMDDLDDMSGTELHGIVREDNSLNDIAFVLLVNRNVYEPQLGENDLMLSAESSISKLVRLAQRQVLRLNHNLQFERDPLGLTQEFMPPTLADTKIEDIGTATLTGMEPEALFSWLASENRSGRLAIASGESAGELVVVEGKPSHAEFKNKTHDKRGQEIPNHQAQNGELAAKNLLGLLRQKPAGLSLKFERLEPNDPQLRKVTIRTSLAELVAMKARA